MLSKSFTLGQRGHFFSSQRGYSSQNLVILVKSDASGWFVDIKNPVWAHKRTPRDAFFEQFSQKCVSGT